MSENVPSQPNLCNTNTPSKLRQPKPRKQHEGYDTEVFMQPVTPGTVKAGPEKTSSNGPQKRRLDSPRTVREKEAKPTKETNTISKTSMVGIGKPILPQELPQSSIVGDRMVKTYKTSAAATSRPPPVTKPHRGVFTKTMGVPKGRPYDPMASLTASSGGRPIWDKSGRLEEMAKEMDALKARMESSAQSNSAIHTQLREAQGSIRLLEDEKKVLSAKLTSKEGEISELEEELRKSRRQLENERSDSEEAMARMRTKMQNALDEVEKQKDQAQQELFQIQRNIQLSTEHCEALKSTVAKQSSALVENDGRIKALMAEVSNLQRTCAEYLASWSETKDLLASTEESLIEANRKLREGESLRRKLHNTVQELKGNIRVFCRVRPLLAAEIQTGKSIEESLKHMNISMNEEEQEEIKLVMASESAAGNQVSKTYPFAFDKIFDWKSTQEQVFCEISQLVQSALDGYRVCIFAYGQTGSGKTFTMEGDMETPEMAGMIPRAAQQIFLSTEALREKGWMFSFECSYLEIYNETIRDLLATKGEAEVKYEIKHVDGKTYVTDLTTCTISQANEIMDLLKKAAVNRAVAETQCNERSSRSHSVFTLKIVGNNEVTTEKIEGLLHLIDLAGSERLGQSGSSGERLKETQSINKSLSSLGDVIHAIANREAHIPYRNSKLTFLLQNSLGGNCKTLMFVNINPAYSSLGESICSLRFATKVNSCQIGTATKKTNK